ncbi:hypothetical protein A3J78_00695 [Candidatus Beckwithbacteria bacterium RBG_13_35_6]|uniref:Peptidyl-tRNA hydrolase n=1 Tax=Candidatus Beckwithbacteria bacterium RBG_13_35_6 TaxID=1797456 RepID=A0A1F5DF55_9BACT|nr:MAG: hypothetical protein A3J78_00695 [Candidatus Beckwithbacteria bacterium RBG_13_35_6]
MPNWPNLANKMKVIIGLGNPGETYRNTRHNVGFMTVELIMQKLKIKMQNDPTTSRCGADNLKFKNNSKFKAEICKTGNILLVKPQTFMNKSGGAVAKILRYYDIKTLRNLHVVHDDLDIKLGENKIQFGKGPKLHKGITSIEQQLKTKDFWRVRIGVENRGEPRLTQDASAGKDYVLQNFTSQENIILEKVIAEVSSKLLNLSK